MSENKTKTRSSLAVNYASTGVEVVATYKLANINRFKLEKVIHKFLGPARLEIEINHRFGKPFMAR